MQKAIKLTDGWVVCGKCGHKLARARGASGGAVWSFKCSNCKEINEYGENDVVSEIRKDIETASNALIYDYWKHAPDGDYTLNAMKDFRQWIIDILDSVQNENKDEID